MYTVNFSVVLYFFMIEISFENQLTHKNENTNYTYYEYKEVENLKIFESFDENNSIKTKEKSFEYHFEFPFEYFGIKQNNCHITLSTDINFNKEESGPQHVFISLHETEDFKSMSIIPNNNSILISWKNEEDKVPVKLIMSSDNNIYLFYDFFENKDHGIRGKIEWKNDKFALNFDGEIGTRVFIILTPNIYNNLSQEQCIPPLCKWFGIPQRCACDYNHLSGSLDNKNLIEDPFPKSGNPNVFESGNPIVIGAASNKSKDTKSSSKLYNLLYLLLLIPIVVVIVAIVLHCRQLPKRMIRFQ